MVHIHCPEGGANNGKTELGQREEANSMYGLKPQAGQMEETLGLIRHDSTALQFEAGLWEERMEAGQRDENRFFFQLENRAKKRRKKPKRGIGWKAVSSGVRLRWADE